MPKKSKKGGAHSVDSNSGLRTLKVGIYARVSTERQAMTKDGSIETQVERLKCYIAFENDRPSREYEYQLAGEYIDPGHSAKDLDRPDIGRLQADIQAGVINCVVITKIDRITRSLSDFVTLDKFFQEHGTVLIAIDDKMDTSTAMGRAMQQLLIVFAELERQLTAERTERQMLERARKGLYNGGYRPWGYSLNPERRGVPTIDPEQKSVVMKIFRRYRDNGSLHDLNRWMHDERITRPEFKSRNDVEQGGTVPDVASLGKMLSNRFYIGKIQYAEQEYDGAHEPLFKNDKEMGLWEAVQEKLKSRSLKNSARTTRGGWKVDPKHVFLLNSLLYCGLCGSALTHDSGTGRDKALRHYYTCVLRKKHGSKRCSCPSIPAEAIEQAILSRLNGFSLDESLMKSILAKANSGKGDKVATLRDEETRLRRKLVEIEKEAANFLNVIRSGGAEGFATIKDELEKLEKLKVDLKTNADLLRSRIEMLEAECLPDGLVIAAYRRLADVLKRADPLELAKILPLIVRKIVWLPASDGTRGGSYKMALFPTPLIPATLAPGGEPGGDSGSHSCDAWLTLLDSLREEFRVCAALGMRVPQLG